MMGGAAGLGRPDVGEEALGESHEGNVGPKEVFSDDGAHALSCWLAWRSEREEVVLSPMSQRAFIGAWCFLLIWGGVHFMQLEHVVAHHLVGAVHHNGCAHHTHDEVPVEGTQEGEHITADGDCPLCDWTGVPALTAAACDLPSAPVEWPSRTHLGVVRDGWRAPACAPGIGWRGPPAQGVL